jgi:hypothetical protein
VVLGVAILLDWIAQQTPRSPAETVLLYRPIAGHATIQERVKEVCGPTDVRPAISTAANGWANVVWTVPCDKMAITLTWQVAPDNEHFRATNFPATVVMNPGKDALGNLLTSGLQSALDGASP